MYYSWSHVHCTVHSTLVNGNPKGVNFLVETIERFPLTKVCIYSIGGGHIVFPGADILLLVGHLY